MDILKTKKRKYRSLLPNDGILSTIDVLKEFVLEQSEKFKTLILIESHIREIRRREQQGVIDNKELTLEENITRKRLLDFIDDIEEVDTIIEYYKEQQKSYYDSLFISWPKEIDELKDVSESTWVEAVNAHKAHKASKGNEYTSKMILKSRKARRLRGQLVKSCREYLQQLLIENKTYAALSLLKEIALYFRNKDIINDIDLQHNKYNTSRLAISTTNFIIEQQKNSLAEVHEELTRLINRVGEQYNEDLPKEKSD